MAVVQTLIGNIKGPQGDTGATGATGPQGEAATITVGSVSTTAYGNPAQVTNVGTEQDAVFNFVIPQGKPGEKITTMSGLTLDTVTTSADDFPIPTVGEVGSVVWGKVIKFFTDVLAKFTKHDSDFATISSSPTTQAFTAGQYLVYNGQLYKVTQTIANGANLVPGTNIQATSAGDELENVNTTLNGLIASKTMRVASITANTVTEVDLTLSSYTLVGVRVGTANKVTHFALGFNQHLYAAWSDNLSNVPIYAFYVLTSMIASA